MPSNKNKAVLSSLSDDEDELPPNPNHVISDDESSDLPTLLLTSFSHRRGPLVPAPNMTFDLRNLPNPPKEMRATQTGQSKPLRYWLVTNEQFQKRFEDSCARISARLIEAGQNEEEVVSVGVRCEMGRHRSVAFVEELSRKEWGNWRVVVEHRDVDFERSRESEKGGYKNRGRPKAVFEDEE